MRSRARAPVRGSWLLTWAGPEWWEAGFWAGFARAGRPPTVTVPQASQGIQGPVHQAAEQQDDQRFRAILIATVEVDVAARFLDFLVADPLTRAVVPP